MNNKIVLVRDLSSLSEARYCAGMLVDFIAFEFNPESETYLEDGKRDEIIQWLSGVKIIGTFKNGSLADVQNCIKTYALEGFLFENSQVNIVNSLVLDYKFLEIDSNTVLTSISDDVFLLSTDLLDRQNAILAYDFLNPKSKPSALGYAFKGSKELRPGFNNYDSLMDAFEDIENI